MDRKKANEANRAKANGKGRENHTKKQATPSQVREQQQQRTIDSVDPDNGASTREVGKKVQSLHEQSDKSLEAYAKRASEIKEQIGAALERQDEFHRDDQSDQVEELRATMLQLTGETGGSRQSEQQVLCAAPEGPEPDSCQASAETAPDASPPQESIGAADLPAPPKHPDEQGQQADEGVMLSEIGDKQGGVPENAHQEDISEQAKPALEGVPAQSSDTPVETQPDGMEQAALSSNCFEPLTARLDPKTKYVALKASLEHHFVHSPQLLEPICKKFINLTGQIETLSVCNERSQMEIQKLTSIKNKLSDLCRELQKANNQIRIESIDLIKSEQSKAKGQAGKIQSTLAGVLKLFDENQRRNLKLKQENVELQGKLKSLLEHCENWEKCVETTLKQREVEIRLLKTELARMKLLTNDEKKKLFKEKADLMKALAAMKEQQARIEGSEAKLRADLSNYASRYDECQEIIHKGLSKFQLESKRMLKQIEQGRRDYMQLLNKYEASNKKIKQLLEEKQSWAQSMGAANNKLEALQRLCRTLKAENDRLLKLTDEPGAANPPTDKGPLEPEASAAQAAEPATSQPG